MFLAAICGFVDAEMMQKYGILLLFAHLREGVHLGEPHQKFRYKTIYDRWDAARH